MGKIKLNKRNNFTMVSNHVLKNKNLSLKAKGLYAYMWSLPDDWDYSVAGLSAVLKEGADAIKVALKELESEGYLVRTILRKGGRFSDVDYILNEYPDPFRAPIGENPPAEKPTAENPQQSNTIKTKDQKKENTLPTVEGQSPQKRSYKTVFDAPENEKVKDALVKFIEYCRGKNYTPKVDTVEKWASTLRDEAGDDNNLAMAMVDQSIRQGWKAIYPLKKSGKADYIKKEAVSVPVDKSKLATNPDGSFKKY